MARIQDEFLECVFYIYPSRSDAETGRGVGGTGFFVGLNWEGNPSRHHVYAVTNKHVIAECHDSVVYRATKTSGETYFGETDDVQWFPSPTDDISVLPISPEIADSFMNVSEDLFVSRHDFIQSADEGERAAITALGPGDKVFMLGRFIAHDGRTKNHASVRFGNISMTAAPIQHPGGYAQESIAAEMRSISGYSGSPTFVYWERGGAAIGQVNRPLTRSFIGLLGLDWGNVPLKLPVLDRQGEPHKDGLHVKSHTSMACVVPAWKLRSLLYSARFKEQRMHDEKVEAESLRNLR